MPRRIAPRAHAPGPGAVRPHAAARVVVPLLAVLLLAAAPARAWGPEGHRVVGLVAESLLTARTRAELRRLVGDEDLGSVGLWLDVERERLRETHPGSPRWHYDNRPVCDPSARPDSWCRDGHCASAAHARFVRVLGDRTASPAERAFALRVVVHVLGDVHQPLHAADNRDRGGNDVNVSIGRRDRPRPLHSAWDGDFVKRALRGSSETAFAERLLRERRHRVAELQRGTMADWMQESYELARDYAYGRLPGFACGTKPAFLVRLPDEYSDGAARIAEERLARAGIRLAGVLNEALGRR